MMFRLQPVPAASSGEGVLETWLDPSDAFHMLLKGPPRPVAELPAPEFDAQDAKDRVGAVE